MGAQQLARRLGAAAIAVVALLATSYFAVLGATAGWPTYQHDASRSGLDPDAAPATMLSPGWNTQLHDKMYAQPLVLGRDVYAATEANTVYALDVDSGAIKWQQQLAPAARASQLPCGNIDPYGITGTPVIDTANGVLYTAALVAGPSVHHELYALNLKAGGAVLYHYPIDASGSDPSAQGQRGALTLANNKVYVPFAGRAGDCGTYAGRVVGVNTGDQTGASAASYVVPGTSRGGIWAAASADANGSIYVATGNSNATGSTPDRGESVVRLSSTLTELDFFTAPEWSSLNASDTDIGSIGPILVKNGWIVQSGKNGMGYLLNSANLGHVGGQLFEARICDPGQEAIAFGAYLAPDTVFIPCSMALKAVHLSTSGAPSFTVTTVRGGYGGNPGSSPPILAGGVLWNLDVGNKLLLGFDPSTGQQLFSQGLAGTPVNFAGPSSGAGHIYVPSGTILEAFSISAGAPTPTSTPTRTATTAPVSTHTSTPTSTATPQNQATYSSRASGAPNPVLRGTTLSVSSTLTGTQSGSVLIDVEIYDPAWNKVFQKFWDSQPLVAGQPWTLTTTWQVPATAAAGTYREMVGVFPVGWGPATSFNDAAGSFSVSANALATATSTPTPLPTSTPTATPTHVAPQPTFTSSASVSPATVHPGGSVSILASVKSTTAVSALVDVEVYDAAWHKVFQQFWDNQTFMAGQTRTMPAATWSVPPTATGGSYTVMVGVFSPVWGTMYNWNGHAATFNLN